MARGRRAEAVKMLKHRQGGMGSYTQAGGMLVMLLCVEDSQPEQKALGHRAALTTQKGLAEGHHGHHRRMYSLPQHESAPLT